jgi:hypothetical protein
LLIFVSELKLRTIAAGGYCAGHKEIYCEICVLEKRREEEFS